MDIYYILAVLHLLYKSSNSQLADTLYIINKDDERCLSHSHKIFLSDFTFITSNISRRKDLNPIYYYCDSYFIVPTGSSLIEDGGASFYFPRFRISALKCGQKLTIIGGHNETSLFEDILHSAEKWKFTCKNTPIIVNSNKRFLRLFWSSGKHVSSHVTIEFTNYLRFSQNYTIAQQRESCLFRQNFWCANDTNLCLSRQTSCNGLDYCFDGGIDDASSCSVFQVVGNGTASRISYTWSNWPWTALVILPIILVCALGRICSQKRQLDIDDDYQYKVSVDQSDEHDDNDSSDGRVGNNQIQDADDLGGFHQSYHEADFTGSKQNGTAVSVTSDYCVPDEKSDWKEDESSSDASGACASDPHYLHVKDAVSSRSVNCVLHTKLSDESVAGATQRNHSQLASAQAQTQIQPLSASNRLTNPVYGNNIYVISPDVATAKLPRQVAFRPQAPKPTSRIMEDEEEFPPPPPPIVEDYVAPGGPGGHFHVNSSPEVRDYQDLAAYTSLQLMSEQESLSLRPVASKMSAARDLREREYDDESVIYAELLVPPQTSRPNNACKKLPNCKLEAPLHMELVPLSVSSAAMVHSSTSSVDHYGGAKPKMLASMAPSALKQSGSANSGGAKPKYNVKIAEPHDVQQSSTFGSNDGTLDRSNSDYDKHYIVV